MTSAHRIGVALAVVLALAACTGAPVEEEPAASSTPTNTASSAEPGTGQPDPGTGGAPQDGDGSQLDPAELVAVLTAVDEAESLNAQVIPDAEIRTREKEAAQQVAGITVTPEECHAYIESSPDVSEGASRGAMTFAGESSLQPDTVSLSSFASAEAARAQVQASRKQLGPCSEFTMDISNQSVRTTVEQISANTAADETLALRTTAQVPGTIQQSITVRAAVGSTVVDVLVGSSTDPEADVARAEKLTDLVVAELRLR